MNILTFKKYVEVKRRKTAERQNLPLAEVAREMPASIYTSAWSDYVVKTFREGGEITTAFWRSLDENLQRRILRSDRALRDNALTSHLRSL